MKLRVLGSSAGGGFPQWNCDCPNCRAVRTGSDYLLPRSQDSLAVSLDGANWFLLNASPDIRQQIEGFQGLHPRALRHSPIAGIFLTNGDLDHCLGLFSLRESQPLTIFCTAAVQEGLVNRNAFVRTLSRFKKQVTWRTLELERPVELEGGLEVVARAVPGKLPIHLEGLAHPSSEDNIGLWLCDRASGKVAVYLSSLASLSGSLLEALGKADCIFLDGTFWSSDELLRLGLSDKRAEEMAHLPVGGGSGSLSLLRNLPARHKYFTHINNSNPMLDDRSSERLSVVAAGWKVATDGLEVEI